MHLESVVKQKAVHEVVFDVLVSVPQQNSVLGFRWIWIGIWIGDWLGFTFSHTINPLMRTIRFVKQWVIR